MDSTTNSQYTGTGMFQRMSNQVARSPLHRSRLSADFDCLQQGENSLLIVFVAKLNEK